MGCTIESSSWARTGPSAPISAKETSGVVAKPSRLAEGCTFETASRKSAIVRHNGASCEEVSVFARLKRSSIDCEENEAEAVAED